MSDDDGKDGDIRLRRGWTTGACATAAAKSAYGALLTGNFADPVRIRLPRGQTPSFLVAECRLDGATAAAAVIKDAGDDPDVTHGATIRAELRLTAPGSGISFKAGPGVGTVTKPGLPLAVGEPAINPGPRAMIADNLADVAKAHGVALDAQVTISVDHGERLARQTWNAKLGILGGLSILGTTGIVIPYSCSAWIASIHQAIDVARATRASHIAACTGSASGARLALEHGLGDDLIVDMGDFAGGFLKYLRRHPIPRASLAGGFAKMSKLAAGHMDLHSKRSPSRAGVPRRSGPCRRCRCGTGAADPGGG